MAQFGCSDSGPIVPPSSAYARYLQGMERLVELSKQLAAVHEPADVVEIVRAAAVELTEADRSRVVTRAAEDDAPRDPVAATGQVEEGALALTLQHGEELAVEDVLDDERLSRALTGSRSGARSLATVGIGPGAQLGAIGVFWSELHRPTRRERRLLTELAALAALTLERVGPAARSDRAGGDALLAKSGAVLFETLDYAGTLENLAQLLVPEVADAFAVDLVVGERVEQVAFHHVNRAHLELARALRARSGLPGAAPGGVGHVIKTGSAMLGVVDSDRPPAPFRDDEALALARTLGWSSFITVPLSARGRTLGALTLVTEGSGRVYGARDVELAEELGRRCALALDNARAVRDADEALRLREDFLSVACHELRTPLTPIKLQTRLLAQKAPFFAPGQEEALCHHLAVIDRQSDRLERIIGDLGVVSRVMGGRLRLEPVEVALHRVVADVLDGLVADARPPSRRIHVDVPRDIVGYWDRVRLEQVLQNLVTNALKYGLEKPVYVTARAVAGMAVIDVEDQGIGIAPEDQERIFRRFERAVSPRHYAGLGVGLFIARQIVEAMGGGIAVRSAPGEGSTFRVMLPVGHREVGPRPI